MNLEEFDNKLSEAFKYEHLPPNDKLWQNISSRLDKKKKPFWFWLVPIGIVALSGWLYNSYNVMDNAMVKTDVVVPNTALQSQDISIDKPKSNNAIENNSDKLTENINNEKEEGINNNIGTDVRPFRASFSSIDNTEDNDLDSKLVSNKEGIHPKKRGNKPKTKDTIKSAHRPRSKVVLPFLADNSNAGVYEIGNTTLMYIKQRKIKTNTLLFSALLPDYLESAHAKTSPIPTNSSNKNKEANFNSKWWWSVGLGPQLAINNVKVNDSMQAYTHRQLWKNKNEITRNGTGFQSQFLLGYKLNKHLAIESGLQYSLRSEYIRLNEESDDIAFRDKGKIAAYQKVVLLFIYKDVNGFYDTTKYNAVQSFTMIANNKYHAITVPLKLNSEFNLSSSTKFQFGLGLGFTYLYSKQNAHYDLMKEEKVTETKKGHFTTSYNTQLALYTNFNNMGEIGIYTGFQGYINRLKVANNQYSIGMRDLQLGMCFRRPF